MNIIPVLEIKDSVNKFSVMDFVKNSKDEKLIKIFKNYQNRVESKFNDFHLHYDILIN